MPRKSLSVPVVETPGAPNPQIVNMLSPEAEPEFLESLTPADTVSDDKPARKPRADKGKPRTVRKPVELENDPLLARARRKFGALGGSAAFKKFFSMIEKPLDSQEEEDVDDYFYLLSKKAAIDPSESWIAMILCAAILVFRLVGTRTKVAGELAKAFGEKKTEPRPEETETDYGMPV